MLRTGPKLLFTFWALTKETGPVEGRATAKRKSKWHRHVCCALSYFFPPGNLNRLLAFGRCSRADLVESEVGNLVGINLRISVDQIRQDRGHFYVWPAVVGIGAFFVVPQTHAEGFGSSGANKRNFILKPLLFAKHGNDLLFQPLGKRGRAVGLQMHRYAMCIHIDLLGCDGQGAFQITISSYEDRKTPSVH